jgi:serine phosphatase RsbU (regulator of sigma subunit)
VLSPLSDGRVRPAAGREGLNTGPARPGRRLVAVALLITLVLSGIAAALALDTYRDARAAAMGDLVEGARTAAGDAAQFMGGRAQTLGNLSDNVRFLDRDRARVAARLSLVRREQLGFTSGLAWVAADGTVVVGQGTRNVARVTEPGLAAALVLARETGAPYISGALPPSLFTEWGVVIAVPVRAPDGAVTGSLAAGIGLSWLNGIAENLSPVRGADISIIDRGGQLIAGPDVTEPVEAPIDLLERARNAPLGPGTVRSDALESGTGPDGAPGQSLGLAYEANLTGWVTTVGRPASETFAAARATLRNQLLGIAGVALIAIVGALVVGRRLDLLADQRDALLGGMRDASERSRFLADATAALDDELTSEDRAARLARLCVPELCDLCVVDLAQGDDGPTRAVAHADPALETLARRSPAPGQSPLRDRVARERTTLVLDVDAGSSSGAHSADAAVRFDDRLAVRQVALVPLVARGGLTGTLALSRCDGSSAFTPADVDLAERLAARAALQIENARLLEREARISAILQDSLLPAALPDVEGVALGARYYPAGDGQRVGGDWYDAAVRPDGALALMVGDVVGRGTRASAVMGQLRSAMRAFVVEGHEPVEVLRRLSDFAKGIPDAHVSTAACATLHPVTGRVHYACAGHPPPLVVGTEAAFLWDGRGGPLAGWHDVRFSGGSAVLAVGEALVLYTDGLVERRGEVIDTSLEALRHAAERVARADPEAFCEALVRLLDAEGGGDDVAVLVARRLG